jgi:hypothetical protein
MYRSITHLRHMIAGPDLDGNGCREVFVPFYRRDRNGSAFLAVAALSGADGRTLWRWQLAGVPECDKDSPLRWWNAGVDGWPQLLVPIEKGPGGQPMTFILSAATGRLTHTLPEVADPKLADFNGDGLADIYYYYFQSSSAGLENYRNLVALRGTPPEPWRQLGDWTPAQDFDGDGVAELVNWEGRARSGNDGRILWHARAESSKSYYHVGGILRQEGFLSPPLPQGDLNGDGTPDLVAIEDVMRRNATGGYGAAKVVSAYSGKDGCKLWTAEDNGMSSGSSRGRFTSGDNYHLQHYPCLDWCDLDQDGRAEVLVAYHADNDRVWLAGGAFGAGRKTALEGAVCDGQLSLGKPSSSARPGRSRWRRRARPGAVGPRCTGRRIACVQRARRPAAVAAVGEDRPSEHRHGIALYNCRRRRRRWDCGGRRYPR